MDILAFEINRNSFVIEVGPQVQSNSMFFLLEDAQCFLSYILICLNLGSM